MAVVSFSQWNRSVEVPVGTTLLQAAREAGLAVDSPCSGAGTCGKCAVQVGHGSLANLAQEGRHRLPSEKKARRFVLSCEARVRGDVEVHVVPVQQHATLQVLSAGQGNEVPLAPFLAKSYDAAHEVTGIYAGDLKLAVEAGDTSLVLYGVVVDIGTTTLAAALLDLTTGKEVATLGALNPQSLHAQDVLSRIRLASEEEGLELMHRTLVEEMARMIDLLARRADIDPRHVYEIVFSGNTCMLHLAVRENPGSLGKYPYTSHLCCGSARPAFALNLPVAASALVYLPPVISAYVGADIVCGIVATELHKEPGVTLLVDIGTNGEMVIACRGRLFATSTAAGPAFEGMNISCGMRASNGAIEAMAIEADGELRVKTIGDAEAIGICGSGLMDIAAELVSTGIVLPTGRFAQPEGLDLPAGLKERVVKKDGKSSFAVTEKVFLTQKDIRQVQLAKGAVRAGIEFLLRTVGVRAEEVDRILIAGSFGYHLRAESLLTIGLLPQQFAGRIEFVGNTSKCGGQALLLNASAREEIAAVAAGIEVVELANHPDFDRCFVDCLGF